MGVLTLRDSLRYRAVPLTFGTSGRRGLVRDTTQLEVYINVCGELDFLRGLPRGGGWHPSRRFLLLGI